LILDDYFSYKGSKEKGVAGAVNVFCSKNNIEIRQISSYGMGGVIMIINKLNNSLIKKSLYFINKKINNGVLF
jgi:hypothetical protein